MGWGVQPEGPPSSRGQGPQQLLQPDKPYGSSSGELPRASLPALFFMNTLGNAFTVQCNEGEWPWWAWLCVQALDALGVVPSMTSLLRPYPGRDCFCRSPAWRVLDCIHIEGTNLVI